MRINLDNKVLRALSDAFDCVYLAFLWMVCSLPVLTAGTATAAVLSVLMGVDRGTGSITSRFFRAFKSNFKLTLLIWLALLLLGAVLALDVYICWGGALQGGARTFMRGTTVVIAVAYLAVVSTIFGITAKFEVSFSQAFYNVLVIFTRDVKCSLALMLLTLVNAASVVCLLALGFLPAAISFYAQARVFGRLFKAYLPEEAQAKPEEVL